MKKLFDWQDVNIDIKGKNEIKLFRILFRLTFIIVLCSFISGSLLMEISTIFHLNNSYGEAIFILSLTTAMTFFYGLSFSYIFSKESANEIKEQINPIVMLIPNIESDMEEIKKELKEIKQNQVEYIVDNLSENRKKVKEKRKGKNEK